jgi:transcriptional regulator
MRHTPQYLMTDPEEVKRLIRNNPWATFVSATSNGLVASHYPVLLDESATDITVLSHFGRPDDELHELGQHQMMMIIQGPHDYVSPSWYAPGDLVPTWNHVTAHLYGTPVILDETRTTPSCASSRTTSSVTSRRAATCSTTRQPPAGPRRAPQACVCGLTASTPEPSSARTRPKTSATTSSRLAADNPALADEMRRHRYQHQGT